MDTVRLNAAAKNRIKDVLDATHFTRDAFVVKYDDEGSRIADITFSARRNYQFAIDSTRDARVFATSECPGIHSEEAETFRRSSLDLCIDAITEWVKRIVDRHKDAVIDEFGGEGG
jgi:hypothetical protein